MKKKQKEASVSSKRNDTESSPRRGDSDEEGDFAPLTERAAVSDGTEEKEEHFDEGESDNGDWNSKASEDEEEDNPEDAGGSNETQDMRNELSNMSFEEIIKLQKKVGTKIYNKVTYGSKTNSENCKRKRLNKNRPVEISAKKPVPFLRQVVPLKKPILRDPRFDDLSGEYKAEVFEKTYRFIDDIKSSEKKIVQRRLKRMNKDGQKKEKLQFLLKRMENQERAKKSQELQRSKELEFKRQQRELANHGARPFFLKKSEKKKLQLADKYQELKKSGTLNNFLKKKRKRNAGKDRRKLPN